MTQPQPSSKKHQKCHFAFKKKRVNFSSCKNCEKDVWLLTQAHYQKTLQTHIWPIWNLLRFANVKSNLLFCWKNKTTKTINRLDQNYCCLYLQKDPVLSPLRQTPRKEKRRHINEHQADWNNWSSLFLLIFFQEIASLGTEDRQILALWQNEFQGYKNHGVRFLGDHYQNCASLTLWVTPSRLVTCRWGQQQRGKKSRRDCARLPRSWFKVWWEFSHSSVHVSTHCWSPIVRFVLTSVAWNIVCSSTLLCIC